MHSIQEVSRHRQQESESRLNSINASASLAPDTNSSTSAFDGEISLTQQLQTINDLSPAFSVESGLSETPKHSFKFIVPVKETPQLRLDLPLPSSIHSAPCSRSLVQESTESSSTKASLEMTVKTLPKPMLGSSAVTHATALLQLSDLPPSKNTSSKEVEESSCLDNVLDSSELEEVEKIEAQIQQETQFDDVSEEDLDLIRGADGRSG